MRASLEHLSPRTWFLSMSLGASAATPAAGPGPSETEVDMIYVQGLRAYLGREESTPPAGLSQQEVLGSGGAQEGRWLEATGRAVDEA